MCAIERHPESTVRDSLTHLLFNLIKRPDEVQRRIIMDVGHHFTWISVVCLSCGGSLNSYRYLSHGSNSEMIVVKGP